MLFNLGEPTYPQVTSVLGLIPLVGVVLVVGGSYLLDRPLPIRANPFVIFPWPVLFGVPLGLFLRGSLFWLVPGYLVALGGVYLGFHLQVVLRRWRRPTQMIQVPVAFGWTNWPGVIGVILFTPFVLQIGLYGVYLGLFVGYGFWFALLWVGRFLGWRWLEHSSLYEAGSYWIAHAFGLDPSVVAGTGVKVGWIGVIGAAVTGTGAVTIQFIRMRRDRMVGEHHLLREREDRAHQLVMKERSDVAAIEQERLRHINSMQQSLLDRGISHTRTADHSIVVHRPTLFGFGRPSDEELLKPPKTTHSGFLSDEVFLLWYTVGWSGMNGEAQGLLVVGIIFLSALIWRVLLWFIQTLRSFLRAPK